MIPDISIIDWGMTQLPNIRARFEESRLFYLSSVDMDETQRGYFRSQNRLLSEMPLCHIWLGEMHPRINPPTGFRIIEGGVRILESDSPIYSRVHYYAIDTLNQRVLCLTPGQFVWPTSIGFNRGMRIENIRRKAPELITILDQEVAILYGDKSIIENRLGLAYETYNMDMATYSLSQRTPRLRNIGSS